MRGFSLIEAIIAAAIIGVGIASIAVAVAAYDHAAAATLPYVQASTLAEEAIEAADIMRDTSWSGTIGSYAVGQAYAVASSSNTWVASSTLSYIDGTFWRTILFSNVSRGSNDQIVSSGGTNDPNTRLVTSSVSWWNGNATSTVSLSAYISDLFNN